MRLVSFLLCFVSACAAIDATATHLGGADRQLDPYSPFVRALRDRPFPAGALDVEVLALVMGHAHDREAARSLFRHVERAALLEILGEPAPKPPSTVELAIQEMSGAEKTVEALRLRVLAKPLVAQLLQEPHPSTPERIHGWSLHHDGAAVWTRIDGGTHRVLGARIVNPGALEVVGGSFTLQIGPPAKALRFECHVKEPIAAGASQATLCYGDRFKPVEDLLRAVRAAAGEVVVPLQHSLVAFRLRGLRFEVRGHEARFTGMENQLDALALGMIRDQSCSARGACGAAVQEKLANPLLAGFVLGIATCFIVLIVAWIAGLQAAAVIGSGIVVVLAVLSVAVVIGAAIMTSKAHILLVLLLTGAAAGHVGDVGTGFLVGVAVFIFAARMLGALVRHVRTT